jgi:S-formylglutathione hydrolase FrmB
VAVDEHRNVYIGDSGNDRVRKVSTDGTITAFAGTGKPGFSGDGGPATQAQLDRPSGVAVDGHGNVYISDANNSRVRKVSAADGTITTLAGTGKRGFSGDGGPATQAQLDGPEAVAVDERGNVYIAEVDNNRVRKVSTDGTITTLAGTGKESFGGDGGPATQADLYSPLGVAVDGLGNVYIAEKGNARVRKVSAVDGTITTVAGTGRQGSRDDGGPATEAKLGVPLDVAVDGRGNIYIAESNRIREVLAPVSLSGQLVVSATHAISGDPIAHARIRFILGEDASARFPNNATSVDVMTNNYGIATAPVLTTGSNVSKFAVHVIDLENSRNDPPARHSGTTSG